MDPAFRHWWRLIDDLPGRVREVHRWIGGPPPPRSADGHLHVTPTSVVCLEGVVRVVAPNRTIDLHPGEVVLIAAGVWHRHEPLRSGSLWFGQGFMPTCSDVLIGDHVREWRGRLPSQPSRRLMEKALTSEDGQRREEFAQLVRQVLSETVDHLPFANQALQRMLHRLWSTLHTGVSVESLVAVSGLSRAHAYRIFTQGYGVSPKAAIATARLWLAEGLLASGLPVAQVAVRCGFPNPDVFCRSWKRVHGAAPSRMRLAPGSGSPGEGRA